MLYFDKLDEIRELIADALGIFNSNFDSSKTLYE